MSCAPPLLLRSDRLALLAVVPAHLLLTVGLTLTLEPSGFAPGTGPLPAPALHLGLACLAGLSLVIGGLLLNDLLDSPHSSLLPSRAAGWIFFCLMLTPAAAAPLGPGALLAAGLLVAGTLFYNLTGRFLPAAGIITLGLMHALMMALPHPALTFAWPLLPCFTLVVLSGALEHHLAQRRPPLSMTALGGLAAGWGFWCLLLLVVIASRRAGPAAGPDPLAESGRALGMPPEAFPQSFLDPASGLPQGFWLLPALVFGAGLLWLWRQQQAGKTSRLLPPGHQAARLRLGALIWLIQLDAAWLLAIGRPLLGLLCGFLALPPLIHWLVIGPPQPPIRGRRTPFQTSHSPLTGR